MGKQFRADAIDSQRAMGGEVVRTFSTRGGKRVERVVDDQGEFVRRTYFDTAVRRVEECNRPFDEAWDIYNELFAAAGVDVVDSALATVARGEHPIIVSEFMPGEPIQILSQRTKTQLISSLTQLPFVSPWFIPAAEGIAADGFVAVDDRAVMIDVDPLLKPKHTGLGAQFDEQVIKASTIGFIDKLADNIDEWSGGVVQDRSAMAAVAARTMTPFIPENPPLDLLQHFSYFVNMANGDSISEVRQNWAR